SSVFAGKAVGQNNPKMLDRVLTLNFQWTSGFIVILTLLVLMFQSHLVLLFTTQTELVSLYHQVAAWLIVFPLVAGYGLTVYG
ncbi:MATE family efflux transporter, partial [Vibrio alfacsensis]|uniref:MATE family efflux transporter n=2 Tax=Vibrio TaxID=662 RepID=UPI004069419B